MRCSFTKADGKFYLFFLLNESRIFINIFLHQFFNQLNKGESEEIDIALDISEHSDAEMVFIIFFLLLNNSRITKEIS